MKHLIESNNFFDVHNILEANLHLFENISFPEVSEVSLSPQRLNAMALHTNFLLENFGSFQEMVAAENTLVRNGYSPVFLTLEGGYFETLNAVNAVNEGFLDMVKSVAAALTNDFSPLGIFQLVLDIIGIIPFDWGGVPINEVANLINALIYFFGPEPNIILGILSMLSGIPGLGSIAFGGLKIILLPFTHVLGPLGRWIRLGDKPMILKSVGALFDSPGSAKVIPKLGEALSAAGKYLKTIGLKLVKKIALFLEENLGKFGFSDSALKAKNWGVRLEKEISMMASGCDEAGELLLKGKPQVIDAASDALSLARKSGADVADLRKLGNYTEFARTLRAEVTATDEFAKFAKAASGKAQEKYIANEVTKKLVAEVIGDASTKSLSATLKDPQVINILAKKYGPNGLDGLLTKALKQNSAGDISKVLTEVFETPGLLKSLNPRTVKSLALFRAHPELLIKGIPKYQRAIQGVESLSSYLKLDTIILKDHKKRTVRRLLFWFTKMYIKNDDCLKWMTGGTIGDARSGATTGRIMKGAGSMFEDSIYEGENLGGFEIPAEDLEALKQNSPEAYALFMSQEKSVEKEVQKLAPADPCNLDVMTAQAAASAYIPDNFMPGIYQEKGMGDAYTGITVGGEENDTSRKLRELSQNYLKAVGEDPNIEPQHPLSATDPYTKAYLCDAYDWSKNSFQPNEGSGTRLDQTLDGLVKAGEINPDQRDEVRSQTIQHWQNDTVPEGFKEMLQTKAEADSPEMYEKVRNLKIAGIKLAPVQIK